MSDQSETAQLQDIMGGRERIEEAVLDHGFVALVDLMPRLVPVGSTADYAIAQAARTSYGRGTKKLNEDEGLIRYLMRHKHTTPFEFCELKFHVRMPIFVARQWIRHRTASVNEYSARYSIVPDQFYIPRSEHVQEQSMANKQGRGDHSGPEAAADFVEVCMDTGREAYSRYQGAVDANIARELARIVLPVNAYTEWYWKCNLHNLFHFLRLRMDPHAQMEIRVYAEAMYRLIKPFFPIACQAFEDYRLNSVELSALEVEALHSGSDINSPNRREREEWEAKRLLMSVSKSAPSVV
jgi:thymidylate synthase (FAD)